MHFENESRAVYFEINSFLAGAKPRTLKFNRDNRQPEQQLQILLI